VRMLAGTTSFAGMNGVGQACYNVSREHPCLREDLECPQVSDDRTTLPRSRFRD